MRAVLIGPSDMSKAVRYGKIVMPDIDNPDKVLGFADVVGWLSFKSPIERYIEDMGNAISEYFDDVVIIPDDGMPLRVAEAYSRRGNKPIGLYPDSDIGDLEPNFPLVNPVHAPGSWPDLNYRLVGQGKSVVCLGYSPGVLTEIGFLKYVQKRGRREGTWRKDIHLFIDSLTVGGLMEKMMSGGPKYLSTIRDIEMSIGTMKSGLVELATPQFAEYMALMAKECARYFEEMKEMIRNLSSGKLPPQVEEELENVFYFEGPEGLRKIVNEKWGELQEPEELSGLLLYP